MSTETRCATSKLVEDVAGLWMKIVIMIESRIIDPVDVVLMKMSVENGKVSWEYRTVCEEFEKEIVGGRDMLRMETSKKTIEDCKEMFFSNGVSFEVTREGGPREMIVGGSRHESSAGTEMRRKKRGGGRGVYIFECGYARRKISR